MQTLQTSSPIGVFDSGIGGLSVANAISGLLPRESLLYVADNARAPYGPQSPQAILAYSQEITHFLLQQGAKLIVVACNTATSLAIDALRAAYPEVPFVGLEPAVKPAREGRSVGVLATAATLNSARYLALKDKFLSNKLVLEDPCMGLVPIIEAEAPGSPRLRAKLQHILQPMLDSGIDTLVLGCTHYPMVKSDIAAVCGPHVEIIDPSKAAARQVERMLAQATSVGENQSDETLSREHGKQASYSYHDFFCTGSSMPLQRSLLQLPTLNAGRRLVVPNLTLSHGKLS